jgi:hypothetical protein
MTLTRLNTATAVLAALLVVTQTAAQAAPTPNDKKQEARPRWEYRAIPATEVEKLAPKGSQDKLTDGLNALGEQGWELVAVAPPLPEPGAAGGLAMPGLGRPPMPGGPGGPAMVLNVKPSTYVFKRAR